MTNAFTPDRTAAQAATSDALAAGLAQLRDIHLPDAVHMWPPAPGWWFAFGLMVLAVTVIFLRVRANRRSLRRAALRELDSVENSYRRKDQFHANPSGSYVEPELDNVLNGLGRAFVYLPGHQDQGNCKKKYEKVCQMRRPFNNHISLSLHNGESLERRALNYELQSASSRKNHDPCSQ